MKTRLTHLILATILVSGCDHTKIKTTVNSKSCPDPIATYNNDEIEYTNTSSSKYLEVTIKYIFFEDVWTETKKLKPGEIKKECIRNSTKVSIEGEREIKDND